MKVFAHYGGFIAVGIEWLMLATCLSLVNVNLAEPVSQYGYYPATKLIFGLGFTTASLIYYLFSRQLNHYWRWTSKVSLAAGIGLSFTAWIPYRPFANGFVFDAHNLLVSLSVILYSTPMLMISFKRVHHRIARLSQFACGVVFALCALAFTQRAVGAHVLGLQLAAGTCFQLWILGVNYLSLTHQPFASDHSPAKL